MARWFIPILLVLGISIFVIPRIKRVHLQNIWVTKGLVERNTEPILARYFHRDKGVNRVDTKQWHHLAITLTGSKEWIPDFDELQKIPPKNKVLLTFEVWGSSFMPRFLGNPTDKIIAGRYDKVIGKICKKLSEKGNNIYIRFNPEMEVSIRYFPWQVNNNTYIKAYRHFAKICRQVDPNIKLVWGPAGYPGALEFYPGDDVVDLMTVTLKGASELMAIWYPQDDSVPNLVYRKIQRLRFVDKPVFILGSENTTNHSNLDHAIDKGIAKAEFNKKTIYNDDNFIRPALNNRPHKVEKLEIGLYDPNLLLVDEKAVATEHIFVDFKMIKNDLFKGMLDGIKSRGHNAIVTIEPWQGRDTMNDEKVLPNIVLGKYDDLLIRVFDELRNIDIQVYLRFAHEMEIPITRYPWQSNDPVDYIRAFRYFMSFTGTLPPNIKRVWGPAGDRGSLEWWPGTDVVDYISIAIYGLPNKNITDPYKQESFTQIFYRKKFRMRMVDKPIFITEFGVKGPEEYQEIWLKNAAGCLNENVGVVGVSYFNMTDVPKAWGEIQPPDWSISRNTFQQFNKSLTRPLK